MELGYALDLVVPVKFGRLPNVVLYIYSLSGFEVVGIFFIVLPLIITAIEDYEKIVGPIITYRQSSKAMKTLTTELKVQRDIFQNECIWVLSRFVDSHELEDIIEDSSHNLRSVIREDSGLDRTVSTTIGPHYGQLKDRLQLIKGSLDEIYEETRNLPESLHRPPRIEVGTPCIIGHYILYFTNILVFHESTNHS